MLEKQKKPLKTIIKILNLRKKCKINTKHVEMKDNAM